MKKVMSIALAVIGLFGLACQKDAVPVNEVIAADSSVCVNSYQDLIELLDTNKVVVRSIVLQNGITITPPEIDIGNIAYSAIAGKQGSSLFNSYLDVKWRSDTGASWQGFTSDVWTLGCISKDYGGTAYTNLLKDNLEIIINTSFTWNVGSNAGRPIKYLIIN